jgi:hypothetical protein
MGDLGKPRLMSIKGQAVGRWNSALTSFRGGRRSRNCDPGNLSGPKSPNGILHWPKLGLLGILKPKCDGGMQEAANYDETVYQLASILHQPRPQLIPFVGRKLPNSGFSVQFRRTTNYCIMLI